jgi:hypothetical protein
MTNLNPAQKARKDQLEKLPSLSKDEATELQNLLDIEKIVPKTKAEKCGCDKKMVSTITNEVIKKLAAMSKNSESNASEPGYYNFRCFTCGSKIVKMNTVIRDGMITVIMPGAKSIQKDVDDPKFGQRPYCKKCNTNVDLSL